MRRRCGDPTPARLRNGSRDADSKAVTEDDEDATPPADGGSGRARLRAVHGPVLGDASPPAVHLWREWKGPTVADLLRDEYVARLPGQVRSALHHLERGDLAAAERALPGEFPPVLRGPCRVPRGHRLLIAFVVIAAVVSAWAIATGIGA